MNSVAEEINDILMHYGTPRHSGRYPWGSGKDPYQRTGDFLSRIELLKKEGWAETPDNIMKEFGMTTTQYRAEKGLAKNERRLLDQQMARSLSKDGLGSTEIARQMTERLGRNIGESTVRNYLNKEIKADAAKATADLIKNRIKETGGLVDIGAGTEIELNISKEKMKQAVALLENEGYVVLTGGMPQVTNKGQQTITKVIGPPDTQKKDFYKFTEGEQNIYSLNEYITRDGGISFEKKFHYPESLDSSRLKILLGNEIGPDGTRGVDKDGVIEIRRGCQDLDLGNSHYSQVRILVDGTHYLKGMAVYSDNLPDGVDVLFNSNKTDKADALKKIKKDPDNPFGSAIKDAEKGGQYWYIDSKTGEKKLGLINKRADEGDWTEWKDKLPSQFLSKQSLSLAKKQLGLAIYDKQSEFDAINSLTNPTIKKHLLNKFADECDSAAVHLQAAALPGQKYHVIIPINTLKDNEIYAPGYDNGTQLALVRYPHGGTFEIPILTVNNKNQVAKNVIGMDSIDAVGINKKNADRLSGADFDGDTVMCIPTNNGKTKIKSTPALKELEGFEPKDIYRFDSVKTDSNGKEHYYRNGKEFKIMNNTQNEMGKISNLITDMTLLGASDSEKARAVKHSMVVIDAEKHKLDYRQSEIDNDIQSLKNLYQNGGGASTLISQSKGQYSVTKRQGEAIVNIKGHKDYDPSRPEGSLIYKTADDAFYTVTKTNKRTGEVTTVTKERKQKSTNMAETDDARSLISKADTDMERVYADYANTMKGLARTARITASSTGKIAVSKEAKAKYANEVKSLKDKLDVALVNAPKERQAQVLANVEVNRKLREAKNSLRKTNPNATESELNKMARKEIDVKKTSQQSLSKYREEMNSVSRNKRSIKITDQEWLAIQKGAISENTLQRILNNTDIDDLRQRATPKATSTLSQAKINKIKQMKQSGNYTLVEIAKATGVSTSTVSDYLK